MKLSPSRVQLFVRKKYTVYFVFYVALRSPFQVFKHENYTSEASKTYVQLKPWFEKCKRKIFILTWFLPHKAETEADNIGTLLKLSRLDLIIYRKMPIIPSLQTPLMLYLVSEITISFQMPFTNWNFQIVSYCTDSFSTYTVVIFTLILYVNMQHFRAFLSVVWWCPTSIAKTYYLIISWFESERFSLTFTLNILFHVNVLQ